MENPFKLTEEEEKMMMKTWKKPKSKSKSKKKQKESTESLHRRHTRSSKQKRNVSEDLYEFL